MKISPCTHSFFVLALSFFTIHSSSALSIDSKAVANLQPRLDGHTLVLEASPSPSTARKKRKCSFTPPVSSVPTPLNAGGSLPVTTSPPANNSSTLAHRLSYVRSYKTKCAKGTSTVSLPASSSAPFSGGGSDTNSAGALNGSPGDSASNGPSENGKGSPGANANTGPSRPMNASPEEGTHAGLSGPDSGASGYSGSEASSVTNSGLLSSSPHGESLPPGAENGQSPSGAGFNGVCGPPRTVTVTSHRTVTVTQVAQAAASADSRENPKAQSDDGVWSIGNTPLVGVAAASSSTGRKRTKCAKAHAAKTAMAGDLSSSSPPHGSSISTSTGSEVSGTAIGSPPASNSGSSGEQAAGSASSGPPGSTMNGSLAIDSGPPGVQTQDSNGSRTSTLPLTNTTESKSASSGTQTSSLPTPTLPPETGFSGNGTLSNTTSSIGNSSPSSPYPLFNSTIRRRI